MGAGIVPEVRRSVGERRSPVSRRPVPREHGRRPARLVPLAGAHSVWLFWDEGGTFQNWYVNLERPHAWHAEGCDSGDTLLDLVCDAPRQWRWKDEDELEVAVAVGAMTREDAAGVRAEGERVAAAIERWESPFGDGWERWRPETGWPAPVLPADWAA